MVANEARPTLWTIGHSNRSADAFAGMLQAAGIEVLADVRRYPASRWSPQFDAAALAAQLDVLGIDYLPMPALGGRRTPSADSPNVALRAGGGLQAYADYMQTPAFRHAQARLAAIAGQRRTAVMCAEAQWQRCHRSLISDAFKAAGWRVLHIDGNGLEEHPYTAAARVLDGRPDYTRAPEARQGSLF